MVNDILNGVKSELTTYQTVISETENMNFSKLQHQKDTINQHSLHLLQKFKQ